MKLRIFNTFVLSMVSIMALVVTGCTKPAGDGSDSGTQSPEASEHVDPDHDASINDDPTHGGWWCVEHGLPEDECAMCNTKLAAKLREKGDWCEEHQRPDSQCFICHPEKAEKYAALYEAKYGKQPPKPTE